MYLRDALITHINSVTYKFSEKLFTQRLWRTNNKICQKNKENGCPVLRTRRIL